MPKLGTMGGTGGRLWLRWVLLGVLVICLSVAFVSLGRWQLDRLQQRQNSNGSVIANENAPVVDWATIFTRPIVEADQWQRVSVTGSFDPDPTHSYVVRYRSNAGATGWEILSPLRTDAGTILISRGFAERPSGQDFPRVAPPVPAGQVTIVGYVRRNEMGGAEAITPADGAVRLINSDAAAGVLGYPLVNGYISAITITPPGSGGLVAVSPPELTEGSHFSYAMQWFAFSVIAGLGLVVLIRSDLRERRLAEARAARQAAENSVEAVR